MRRPQLSDYKLLQADHDMQQDVLPTVIIKFSVNYAVSVDQRHV